MREKLISAWKGKLTSFYECPALQQNASFTVFRRLINILLMARNQQRTANHEL